MILVVIYVAILCEGFYKKFEKVAIESNDFLKKTRKHNSPVPGAYVLTTANFCIIWERYKKKSH